MKKDFREMKFKIFMVLLLSVIIGGCSKGTKDSIILENSNFKYEIGSDGTNLNFTDKATGKDYLD